MFELLIFFFFDFCLIKDHLNHHEHYSGFGTEDSASGGTLCNHSPAFVQRLFLEHFCTSLPSWWCAASLTGPCLWKKQWAGWQPGCSRNWCCTAKAQGRWRQHRILVKPNSMQPINQPWSWTNFNGIKLVCTINLMLRMNLLLNFVRYDTTPLLAFTWFTFHH